MSAVNDIFIGKEQGSSGTMIMTDGTISTSGTFRIGHNQSTGVLTQSGGTVNVQNEVNIGNESGTGTFNLNGGTVMTRLRLRRRKRHCDGELQWRSDQSQTR